MGRLTREEIIHTANRCSLKDGRITFFLFFFKFFFNLTQRIRFCSGLSRQIPQGIRAVAALGDPYVCQIFCSFVVSIIITTAQGTCFCYQKCQYSFLPLGLSSSVVVNYVSMRQRRGIFLKATCAYLSKGNPLQLIQKLFL